MSTPSAGSSQPGRPVESSGRSLDDAKEVGRAAETDRFAVTDGALADAAGVLVEALWPTPGLTTVKSPNSVATARKIAPNPFDEVLSGRHEPSAYRSIVASVSVGSAARSTMLTCADAGAVNAAPWSSVTLEPDTHCRRCGPRTACLRRAPAGSIPRIGLGTGRKRQTGRPGEDLRLRLELGGAKGDERARATPDRDLRHRRPWLLLCCPGGGSSQTIRLDRQDAVVQRWRGRDDQYGPQRSPANPARRARATRAVSRHLRATTSPGRRARERPPAPRPHHSPCAARPTISPRQDRVARHASRTTAHA